MKKIVLYSGNEEIKNEQTLDEQVEQTTAGQKIEEKAKKEIGYMPEGVPLYMDLTVKEFVTYMPELKGVPKKEKKDKKKLIQIGDIYTKETLQKDIDNGIITRILTILSYNQYMANCYKVGGEDE